MMNEEQKKLAWIIGGSVYGIFSTLILIIILINISDIIVMFGLPDIVYMSVLFIVLLLVVNGGVIGGLIERRFHTVRTSLLFMLLIVIVGISTMLVLPLFISWAQGLI